MPQTKECSCGMTIAFGRLEGTDKKIPMDLRTPVYQVLPGTDMEGVQILRRMGEGYVVNHFKTCPDANRYTRKKGGPAK